MSRSHAWGNGHQYHGPWGGDSQLGGPCMDSWELDPQLQPAHWWTIQP